MSPFVIAAAAIAPGRALQIVLLVGVALLTIALGVMTWTRWGQGRPITKCAILSLFAHVLLFCFCWGTRIFFDTPGRILGDGEFHVRIVDSADEEMAPESESASETLPAENAAAAEPAEEPKPETKPEPEQVAVKPHERPIEPPLRVERPEPEPSAEETVPIPPPVEAVVQETKTDELPTKTDAPEADEPAATDSTSVPVITEPIVPRRLGDGQEMPDLLRARVGNRLLLAERFGGNATTEGAVEAALAWLAANQSAGGRWDADLHGAGRENHYLGHNRQGAGKRADTGITGLALLAFLGAGQSHLDGKHREHVQHGLEFLLASQAADGNLYGDAELFARMYCHGIATLALCEAYALTGDERLKNGVHRAVGYSLRSQHVEGGWRYQPGDRGDMSQFGWQVMALKSAELAGIPIPAETKFRMTRFLQSCSSGTYRGLASYRALERPSRTMTAEALVCRGFLNAENRDETLTEGARFVVEELPSSRQPNVYYWYYGTLAMFQRQGNDWRKWNAALQPALLDTQRFDGQLAGSWDPDQQWGAYGGRVYSTALGALCLEVYYRYLPLHGGEAADRFTELPETPLPR
ncbi:MAG TPA: squalene--hopene cyclase [Pirellulaceae bacterium]|nr:squalene--hopene cyclase [Pirellulaceae bacterium]